jgi:hypothetical protein
LSLKRAEEKQRHNKQDGFQAAEHSTFSFLVLIWGRERRLLPNVKVRRFPSLAKEGWTRQ